MATTEFSHIGRATAPRGFSHLVEAGVSRVAAAWTAVKNRRLVSQLASWDDRMLGDIGVTRGDVQSALAAGLVEDPSSRLNALAAERKFAARSQGRGRHNEWRVDV